MLWRISVISRLFIALAVLMTVGGAVAAEITPLIVPLTVNGVERGDVIAGLVGDDVLIRISDLERAGASGPSWKALIDNVRVRGQMVALQGDDAVSLMSLRPLVSYEFDEAALSLSVILDAGFFGTTALAAESMRPKNLVYSSDTSTFFNYALGSTGLKNVSFFGEAGRSIRGNLLYSSFSHASEGSFTRGVTSYTIDQRDRLRRWVFGDAVASTRDRLGGGAVLAGVTVSRNFGLDPYFIRQPSMTLHGTALAPSKVDVYVNGILVAQREVPPGEFELTGLPVATGAGNVQLVVRDPFGGKTTTTSSFYASSEVLARGLSEFTYSFGVLRRNFGGASFDYSDPALVAEHRLGITDSFTAGGRVEATNGTWSLGPSMIWRSRFGDIDLSLAASGHDGSTGHAVAAGYRYLARKVSFGGTMESVSGEYANLSRDALEDRALLSATGFVAVAIPRASLALQVTKANMRDEQDSQSIAVLSSFPIGRRISAFASAGITRQGGIDRREVSLGITLYAGKNTTVNSTIASRGGETESFIDVQRPLPAGSGMGYRFRTKADDISGTSSSAVQYQSPYGRYEVTFDPFDLDEPTISAAGGIVLQSGNVALTRPVQDSFALVRVPGVAGVRVYAANQLIGRTDRRGNLFLPSLLSYYGNQIRIEDQDVPLEYEVLGIERSIAPPFRGGALVEFPVARVTTVSGSVLIQSGSKTTVPSFGQMTIHIGDVATTSPLGRDGEFYFENFAAGSHEALVEWGGGRCELRLTVPQSDDPIIDLGPVTCTSEARQ